SDSDPIEHAEMISLEYDDAQLRYSDFQFVESFTKTEEVNMLSKSGFDLIPFVGDFFEDEVKNLTFYTELYNLDKNLEKGEDFLFRYYLESFETTVSLSDYNRFQRQKAGPVNVVFATIPIADLPSGNYNLVVEARNKNNDELLVNKIFFQRHNPGSEIKLEDLKSIDITATFAEKITELDSIRFYVASLYPVANQMEKQYLTNVVNSKDVLKMQKFLYNFWQNKNSNYPEAEWNRYKAEVWRVEQSFKTRIKHGFETDQGRIWLKYGAPNDSEFSDHEPNSYPYIMWHYYSLGNQTNKRFIFYNPHLVGTEYILIHSDARGEVFNPYWEVDLHGRNTSVRNYDDASFDTGWGSRSSSRIIR
ncbi:MAG: GWxTD domain-containing protein, partial [Bacteroidales bacterium]|nr:GWxTD domain-containing protein [Bacteroidales bacterium]